jgi:hypothetical protein
MAIDVKELFDSGEGGVGTVDGDVEARYRLLAASTDSLADIEAALLGYAPSAYRGLYRASPPKLAHKGGEVWEGRVRYAANAFAANQVPTFTFSTAGGTKHIQWSKKRKSVSAIDGTGNQPPNHGGLIGVYGKAGQKQVAGTDVVSPQYKFSETHYFSVLDVDNFYKGILFSLTGRVCNAPFKGLNPGECLFLGATGTLRDQFWWEINYDFAGSPNSTNVVLNEGGLDQITVAEVGGWDYLWVETEEAEDGTAFSIKMNLLGAYVDRVYDDGDFSFMGIGVD